MQCLYGKLAGLAIGSRYVSCQGIKTSAFTYKKTVEQELNLKPKPKKPGTIYAKYLSDIWPKIAEEHPNTTSAEKMHIVAQSWKTVDESTKAKLAEEYSSSLARFKKELDEYEKSLTPSTKAAIMKAELTQKLQKLQKAEKKENEHNRPKKPPGAFLSFVQDKKKESGRGNLSNVEFLREMSKAWESLSPDEKNVYKDKHQQAMSEFRSNFNTWKSEMEKNVKISKTSS